MTDIHNDEIRLDDRDMDTLDAALDEYGVDAQFEMMEEECAELLVASKHRKRGKLGDDPDGEFVDELADVMILCDQLALVFGPKHVERRVQQKLDRLRGRLPPEHFPDEAGDGEVKE